MTEKTPFDLIIESVRPRPTISTESVLEVLKPLINRSDEGTAQPVRLELTETHWNDLNRCWDELVSELRRECSRFEEPLPPPF